MEVRFPLGAQLLMKYTILTLFLFLAITSPTFALYDPATVPNNKYGIHIADVNDITELPALLNSNGGDWGYVTLVIPDTDRDTGKWQGIMNSMRRLHLIPIVRLATHVEGDSWKKPTPQEAEDWTLFLSRLNWPIENRYVVLFNEPNHAKEWGNSINPDEYAKVIVAFAKSLKVASEDFFILPAGLDASAASDNQSLDEATFIANMKSAQPDFFTYLDGWTSHAYPNPGFSGSPYATGRGTLRTYQWELGLLGVEKPLPVFITETGWLHSEGKYVNFGLADPSRVGENLRIASSIVWSDPRVVAVTPFVYSYQDTLFDHFSWKSFGTQSFYAQYFAYQGIPKIKGSPRQRESYLLSESILPASLVSNSTYTLSAPIKNNGQGILDEQNGYAVEVSGDMGDFSVLVDPLPFLEPNQVGSLTLHIKTPQTPGVHKLSLAVRHAGMQASLEDREVTIIPPPGLLISAQLGWRLPAGSGDVQVLVYDKNTLLQKFTGLSLSKGELRVEGLINVIPEKDYRVVVLVPYYLPRQYIGKIRATTTQIHLKRFLPFDLDRDGTLTVGDLVTILKTPPKEILGLFIGP